LHAPNLMSCSRSKQRLAYGVRSTDASVFDLCHG
jgi:hypothetical protein